MFNLGLTELLIFGMIAVVVLGDKLPQSARWLGKWYAIAMHAKNKLTHDVLTELQWLEAQAEIQQELAKLKASEQSLKTQMQQLQGAISKNRYEILSLQDDANGSNQQNSSAAPVDHDNISKTRLLENAFIAPLVSTKSADPIPPTASITPPATKPMTGHFFLLSNYDKQKRLPPAPKLPNRHADSLLFAHAANAVSLPESNQP